ncbi:VirB8/TrbF family protein (plasmid) [Guyparkeria sp. 1SP6A2]|nr:VirB8/TrbF family protein [Guyparkeria sp. 1SP6A2]
MSKEKATEKDYFDEARSWDADRAVRAGKSERRAWTVAGGLLLVAVAEAVALSTVVPLKEVSPFVIRVDNNTGYVDVVSELTGTAGSVDQEAQEVLDKYWIGQYVRHRESYQYESRNYDRQLVGVLSSTQVQQQYASWTSPKENPRAPVSIYGSNAEVDVKIKAISFIGEETVDDENRRTALIRYTKQVERKGERTPITHWAATVVYTYRDTPMQLESRRLNPLGFQVVSYRNDREAGGEQ